MSGSPSPWQLVVLGLAVLALPACEQAEAQPDGEAKAEAAKPAPPEAKATRVEVATVKRGKAALSLTLPGEVEGVRDALLAAPLGGYVEAVHVASGDRVRKGAPLVHVDTATHSARRAQAEVELEAAEREYRRAKQLGDALPSAELDGAESRVKAAKAAAWTAQVQASRTVIGAPFEGIVTQVEIEVGEVAAPGAPLVRLVQLDPAKVTVSLSDRDVVAIHKGVAARVSADAKSGMLEGTVKHIQPAADLRTRSFIAEVEIPNEAETLLPGMIVSVALEVPLSDDQLVIPQDWLVTGMEEIGVFLDEGNVARWRVVELGPVIGRDVVVKSGLEPGEPVVITGHRALADGDPLLVTRRGTCCTNGRVVFE